MTKQATTKDIENLLNEDYKETMNIIKWNGKEYKIPAYFANNIGDEKGLEMSTHTNPYSGQSTMLTDEEYLLYLNIKDAEWAEQYTVMQKGLDKFSRLNAKAYMILLD